jgi:hypothetical protein
MEAHIGMECIERQKYFDFGGNVTTVPRPTNTQPGRKSLCALSVLYENNNNIRLLLIHEPLLEYR